MTTGEIVLQNPKESAVIFGCVVVIAVMLEVCMSYFRSHRSTYVSGLFAQMSEETMIVGCICLLFVFVVQSFPDLPLSWVVIFRWAQGVIFFMIVFFVCGVTWTAFVTRILCVMIQRFETTLMESLTRRQNADMCDALRKDWGVTTNRERDAAGGDKTVDQELDDILTAAVQDVSEVETEMRGLRSRRASKSSGGIHEIAQAVTARKVQEIVGDAALRLQDFFLEGNGSRGHDGLVDPEPKSTLQSTVMVLRRVFLHQIRSKRSIPVPMQGLIVTAEKIRIERFMNTLDKKRKLVLANKRFQRDSKRRQAGGGKGGGGDEVFTYEDLMNTRRRQARQELLNSSLVSDSPELGEDDDDISVAPQKRRPTGSAISPTNSADVISAAVQYSTTRSQSWILDGSIDPEVLCRFVPFSKYIYKRMRTTVVSFVDITWQCWMSLVVASSINSVRMFLLPNDIQSRDVVTSADFRNDFISFIFVLGFLPMIGFLVAFVLLMRNFRWYLNSVKELRLGNFASDKLEGEENPNATTHGDLERNHSVIVGHDQEASFMARMERRAKEKEGKKQMGTSVWLPPDQLAGQLAGDLYEDPSRYLLRGNRSFTLHTLKIPALLTHYYFAILVMKMWGSSLGVELVAYAFLGLLPVVIVFSLLPLALFAMSCLMGLGLRIDKLLVFFQVARQCRRVAGHDDERQSVDDDGEENDRDELLTVVAPLVPSEGADGEAKRATNTGMDFENQADVELMQRNLVRRILGIQTNPSVGDKDAATVYNEIDDATTVVTTTQTAQSLRSGTGSGRTTSTTMSSAGETAMRMRLKVMEDALTSIGMHHLIPPNVVTSGRKRESLAIDTSFTDEQLLQVAGNNGFQWGDEGRGRQLPVNDTTDALLERSARSISFCDFPAVPERSGPQTSQQIEAAASPTQGSDGVQFLLSYYKSLLDEQRKTIEKQRARIEELKSTQRGGVLSPDYLRQGTAERVAPPRRAQRAVEISQDESLTATVNPAAAEAAKRFQQTNIALETLMSGSALGANDTFHPSPQKEAGGPPRFQDVHRAAGIHW